MTRGEAELDSRTNFDSDFKEKVSARLVLCVWGGERLGKRDKH